MNRKLMSAVVLVGSMVGAAHADTPSEVAGDALGKFVNDIVSIEQRSFADGDAPDPAECYAVIDRAKSAGIKASDKIRSYEFDEFPVDLGAVKDTASEAWWLPLSKVIAICDRYREDFVFRQVTEGLGEYFDLGLAYVGMTMDELLTLSGADSTERWDHAVKRGEECIADVDKAIAAGATADRPMSIDRQTPISLLDFRKSICQAHIDFATKMRIEVPKAAKSKHAAIEDKFKAVGIKGERLALFVDFDAEWYLPGCESSTDDPKKLKKAKKLFQWLTAPDGLITIRKFAFKGDNYSVSEKTTYSEDKAYKLCR